MAKYMANGFKLGESLSPPSLSPNKVLITNNAGKAETSAITTSELNALSGIQGNIQQQINNIGGVSIDDTTASTSTVYSSSKTEDLINSSLTNLKNLLYPIGCIVQTTAYSTVEQMCAVYGGQDWDLIEDRVLMGASSPLAANQKYVVNQTGGSDTVTLTTANLPSHNHTYTNTIVGSTTLTTNQIPSHSHKMWSTTNALAQAGSNYGLVANNATANDSGSTGGGGSHTHGDISQSKTTGNIGSGTAVSIVQSYYTVYIWTRTV